MSGDAKEARVCGNQVQDATRVDTRCQDAQDTQDGNLTSLASGCKVDASDAMQIFADVLKYSRR